MKGPDLGGCGARWVPFPADFVLGGDGFARLPAYASTKHVNVKERWRGRPLAEVLLEEFGLSGAYLREAAAEGRLLVNRCPCQAEDALQNGDLITHTYTVEEPPLRDEAVSILAESDCLLVVHKPAGMPCHPQGKYQRASLTEVVRRGYLGETWEYIHPVNRLDRQTSGVVLLAKTRKGYILLSRELGEMQKLYVARVTGCFEREALGRVAAGFAEQRPLGKDAARTEEPWVVVSADIDVVASEPRGFVSFMAGDEAFRDAGWHVTCNLPLRVDKHRPGQPLTTLVDVQEGKPATTHLRWLHGFGDGSSLVLCRPFTGRTHQIRVHLGALGLPIVGDVLYGGISALLGPAASAASAAASTAPGAVANASDASDGEAPLCLHAAAYAVCARRPVSDEAGAAGVGCGIRPDESRGEGASLEGVLPLPAGVSAMPATVVYRCLRSPAWVEEAPPS